MKLFNPTKMSSGSRIAHVKTSLKTFKPPTMKTVRMTVVKPPKMSVGKSKIKI